MWGHKYEVNTLPSPPFVALTINMNYSLLFKVFLIVIFY